MSETRRIRGCEFFIEDLGDKSTPALLYLHGGPGTGSYDFVLHQHALLTDDGVRLIAFDQRGVLRSSAISDEDEFGLMRLIEDCEAIRESLEIPKWSVLGHSFGGYLGLLYAGLYPGAVEKLIFENAAFDLGMSARSLLQGAALEYGALGNGEKSLQCLALAYASPNMESAEIWDQFTDLTNDLGDRRNNLYIHGSNKNLFEQIIEQSPFSTEDWAKAGVHQQRLFKEGKVFSSALPPNTAVSHPTLLLKGKFDYVMGADQIHRYMSGNPNTGLVVFEESSHFPHIEEAGQFANKVKAFMLEN